MSRLQMAICFSNWPLKPADLHLEEKERGRGSYGVVFMGKLSGNPVAVKFIHSTLLNAPDNHDLLKNFKEECHKLRTLDHPRVVKLLGTFWDKKLGPLLVMEGLVQNLEEFLQNSKDNLSIVRQLELVKEITEGLCYLHSQNIIHRDLKPQNILVGKDGHLRIGDLGQSKLLKNLTQMMHTTQPGTALFLPPEALKKGGAYTSKIDIFSLGVVSLCVATRQATPTVDMFGIGTVSETIRRKDDLERLGKDHPLEGLIVACLQDAHDRRPDVQFIDHHLTVLV